MNYSRFTFVAKCTAIVDGYIKFHVKGRRKPRRRAFDIHVAVVQGLVLPEVKVGDLCRGENLVIMKQGTPPEKPTLMLVYRKDSSIVTI